MTFVVVLLAVSIICAILLVRTEPKEKKWQ